MATSSSLAERAKALVQFRPGDIASESGRARERYRRARLTTVASMLSKALSMVVLLLGVPLTLPYLGAERFGIWMTISSFASLLAFLDFGIGNGLLNKVAQAAAGGDPRRLQVVASSGLLVLALLGVAVGLLLLAVIQFVPWLSIVKVNDSRLGAEIVSAARTFACIFGLSLPLVGVQRVFLGLQEGFLVYLASAGASVLSLGLLTLVASGHGSIPTLVVATFGVQSLAPLLLVGLLRRRGLLTIVARTDLAREGFGLVRAGGVFFLLQVAAMIGWGSDSLIVSSTLGASAVAVLAVATRLFQLVSQPVAMATNPLWSSYADAEARQDVAYIRRTLTRSLQLTLVAAGTGVLVLLALHDRVIAVWTDHAIVVPVALALGYATWTVVEAVGNAFAMFLNGCGVLRPQLVVASIFCVIAIPMKILLLLTFGLPGVIWASLLSYLICVALPYATVLRPSWQRHLEQTA